MDTQEVRAEACISAMAQGQVYALYLDDDWVMVLADDLPSMPIWAEAGDAEVWQQAHYPKARVRALSQQAWQQKWQQNLSKDKCLLLLAPSVEDDEGILVTPAEFTQYYSEEA